MEKVTSKAISELNFNFDNINTQPFPISEELTKIVASFVNANLDNIDLPEDTASYYNYIIISFVDSNLSKEDAGFQPFTFCLKRACSISPWHYKKISGFIHMGGEVSVPFAF